MQKLPKPVVNFLIKAGVFFGVWKLVYLLWLQPAHWPDKPLVNLIAKQTVGALNAFNTALPYSYQGFSYQHSLNHSDTSTNKPAYEGYMARIFYKERSLLLIVSNCNALELMVLFAGFIIAYKSKWQLKLVAIPLGIIAIHVVNVLRCMALVKLAGSSWSRFFYFTHHYLFTLIIYAFIFILWMGFIKLASKKSNHAQA